jgi:uncharacterized membrane protein HdeD (DUF308 family)
MITSQEENSLLVSKFKPAVSKYWLATAAGLMWTAVGLTLCGLAYEWLAVLPLRWSALLGVVGIILALVVYRFAFSKIALKNIDRLRQFPDRVCFFAFQAWKSYLVIAFMVVFGFILRHSTIPKCYLSVPYTAIGGALLLSSFHYYAHLWRPDKSKETKC